MSTRIVALVEPTGETEIRNEHGRLVLAVASERAAQALKTVEQHNPGQHFDAFPRGRIIATDKALTAALQPIEAERDLLRFARQTIQWIAKAWCDEQGNPLAVMPRWAHVVSDALLLGKMPSMEVLGQLSVPLERLGPVLAEARAHEGMAARSRISGDWGSARMYGDMRDDALRRALAIDPQMLLQSVWNGIGATLCAHTEALRREMQETAAADTTDYSIPTIPTGDAS